MILIKNLSKTSIFYLIIFIFDIIGFLITAYVGLYLCIIPKWKYVMAASIPMIVFGIIFFCSLKGRMHHSSWITMTIILSIMLFAAGCINGFLMSIEESTTSVKDPKYYTKVLKNYGYPGSDIHFFPKRIPVYAIRSEFYETPQFLQGGASLYLLVELNHKDFNKIITKITKNTIATKLVEEDSLGGNITADGYYITAGFFDRLHMKQFTGNWTYYIYENNDISDNWNHGEIAGAAVNEDDHVVVYYKERW